MMFQDILFAMRCEQFRRQPVPAVQLQVMLSKSNSRKGNVMHLVDFNNPRISGTKQTENESGIKVRYKQQPLDTST